MRDAILARLARSQPLRFIAVGVLNTIFGYVVYLIGLFAGLVPELALAVSVAIGATFNYFTTGRLVFGHASLDRMLRFFASYATLYIVNAIALRAFVGFGIPPAYAQAILVLPFAAISYLVFKFLVFRPREVP